jgi:hypothetical protein
LLHCTRAGRSALIVVFFKAAGDALKVKQGVAHASV